MLHWDGQAWDHVASNTDAAFWSVWAMASDDAWAVGGEIVHWDGTEWRRVRVEQ